MIRSRELALATVLSLWALLQAAPLMAAESAQTDNSPADAQAVPHQNTEAPVTESEAAPAETAASSAASVPAAPRRDPIRLDPSKASITPLVQPRWHDLNAAQRQVLAPFSKQWAELPLNEKRAWADLARRFPEMNPQDQARTQRRISEWASLTPEERKLARANYRLMQQVGRDQLLTEWERYQSMTPEQRAVLGTAGSTSNTAARHAGANTGLAKEAAQPLPRRAPPKPSVASDAGMTPVPSSGVSPTVGSAPSRRP